MNKLDLNVRLKMIDKITEPARRAQRALGGAGSAIDKLQTSLKNTKALQKNLQAFKKTTQHAAKNRAVINSLNQTLKTKGKLTDAQNKKLKLAQALSNKYATSLRSQSQALKKTGISTKSLGAAEARLNAKHDKTAQKIGKINKKLKRMLALRKKLSKIHKGLAIGGAASLAGGLAAGRGMAGFFNPAIQFDKVMSTVQARAGLDKSSPELKALRGQAKSLGANTSFTGSEVASGQAFLAQANFNAEQIQQAMPSMVDLAKAGGLDLPSTADIASNIMGAFKLTAEQSTRVADILAHTATTSNVDLQMLGDTMKGVAPIAATAGASLETVAAMTGLLGNIGIQGSQADTALKNMFARMASPPKDAENAFKDLGISTVDAKNNLKQMPEILAEVAKATEKMGNASKLKYFKAITGLRGMAAVSELVSQAENGKLQEYIDQLEKTKGSAERIRSVMESNASGDIQKMKSAWQGLSIESLASSNDAFREIIQSISKLINKITSWVNANPELVATILKVTAGIVALAVVAGTAAISLAGILLPIKMLIGTLKILRIVMLANPVLAIITAIAAAAYLIYDNWKGITGFFTGIWDTVKSLFYSGIVFIIKAVKRITSIIPDKFLPDSMSAESLDKTINKYKQLSEVVSKSQDMKNLSAKIDTTATQRIVADTPQKPPNSKVDVMVKIDSQVPATVEKVKTTGITNINLDVGNLATSSY